MALAGRRTHRFMIHLAIWDGPAERQDGAETAWGEHGTEENYAAH